MPPIGYQGKSLHAIVVDYSSLCNVFFTSTLTSGSTKMSSTYVSLAVPLGVFLVGWPHVQTMVGALLGKDNFCLAKWHYARATQCVRSYIKLGPCFSWIALRQMI